MYNTEYRIFSIKRHRCLFQTWPNGPGIYLKPAFNRGPAFINEVFFLLPFCQVDLLSPNLRDPAKLVPNGRFFPSFCLSGKLSLGLLLVTHHSIQHAYYSMLQSRCVKKEHKQYMLNMEAR